MSIEDLQISAPEHLTTAHDLSSFDFCGVPELDDWLQKGALAKEETGASRTYVGCSGNRVAGYYALATGSVAQSQAQAPGRVRRNMPDPVPVMILGRLAVDRAWQGQSLGRSLLRDAVLRTLRVATIAGIRAILVQAISEDAKRFYERYGFRVWPIDPMTLIVTIADAEKALLGK
ncbi:MAG: GNAT family N-acetyltransferase [Acidobacteriota bacterium]|nr:GNAT family N-acetyltransferase [Acidobacteriota bacterium]